MQKDSVFCTSELLILTKMEVRIREIVLVIAKDPRVLDDEAYLSVFFSHFQIEVLSAKSSKLIANVNVSEAQATTIKVQSDMTVKPGHSIGT